MITLSNSLPIKFWLSGQKTFNDKVNGFTLSRSYYHQWHKDDIIKLQIVDTDKTFYSLYFVDENGIIITSIDYEKTVQAGLNIWNLEFSFADLDVAITDQRVRCYIVQNVGSLDAGSLDSGSLDTESSTFDPTSTYYAKSDYMDVLSEISYNAGWATEVLKYKSLSNYANIQYPNNGNYFNLRIPCRLFNEREQNTVEEIQLSDTVLVTSRSTKFQIYLEPYQLPVYMMKIISSALRHGVTGSVTFNDVEYEAEAFEWSPTDVKAPFSKGKVWLTDKNNFDRNII